ncbi:MAG TPA: hypothetical protein VKE70_10695 [Candidatus Solibacter sp.]|nr:hypothetical protein [Candidatus Solibacter sp.]
MFLMGLPPAVCAQNDSPYTIYTSFDEVLKGRNARYPAITRVSDPGTDGQRVYTGFFFYQCLQFDATDRYLLGMRVYVQNRAVQPSDRGDIGFIDLRDGYKWTKIGETTAWNWQQGARLQWRPASNEIVWNDRSEDGKNYVCRVYDFRTGKRRTLPRPIYDISPDGTTALTHDFERMKHRGTDYVGIPDKYRNQCAPDETGIWKMNMDSGKAELIMSLRRMAAIAYPKGTPSFGCFYFFREGWNPSGTRFIAFVKDPENNLSKAFSMTPAGTDVRYLYNGPSHHSWLDDNYILDFGNQTPPGGGAALGGYFLFQDDGSGTAKNLLWATKFDGHNSFLPGPGGDWIISDTYSIHGFQYLFLYHRPAKVFVPLAKLKSTAGEGIHRVDLHPRLSRNGKMISIDATYEDLGRQMYMIDIGPIVDNPPKRGASSDSRSAR